MSEPTFPCWSCGAFHSASEVAEAGGYCPQCEADYDERLMMADLAQRYVALEAENAKLRAELERRAVPDGCLIVPIQPTEEMRKRAQDYLAAEGMIVSDWLAHTVYTEMLAAAPSAPAAQGWIPVSERLPAPFTIVALLNTDQWMNTGGRLDFEANWTGAGWLNDCGQSYWNDIGVARGLTLDSVTHWMPLPAAPAQGGE